jgi:hypothetical protein
MTNIFELRTALGGGAFDLPQLTTAAQDIWQTTSASWFDRTADLRTALYGHSASGPAGGQPSYLGPA